MSIVTKTGDRGETSLYSGDRVSKAHPRIEAVGTLDELNAHMAFLNLPHLQNQLFELGALVANPASMGSMTQALQLLEEETAALEATQPALQNFILPGGHDLAKHAHVARAVCRRAERILTQIEGLPEGVVPFMNRLSDYLFLFAREANLSTNTPEVIWKGQS
jgi:cob(I)alamin adenosyltransferase